MMALVVTDTITPQLQMREMQRKKIGYPLKMKKEELWCASYENNDMGKKEKDLEQEFQRRLKGKIRERRKGLKLRQADVAKAVGVSLDTYQHWESPSQPLNNLFDILSVCQALGFSSAEVVDVLGLVPLTPSEIKAVCQDGDMLKSIQGNTIYSVIREKCPDIDDFTLERLLVLIFKERFKRFGNRQGKL